MAPKKKTKKSNSKKKKLRLKILKWTSLCILAIAVIIIFLLSDLFNIKEINVKDNSRISTEEIISLSGITINENMFKFLKLKAIESIKTNPYIEEARIHRKLNGTIEIKVKERIPTYMLYMEEGQYAYINNQGYILETSNEKLEKPIITGYVTEDIEAGNRLEIADLKKLNTIIKIMNTANERGLSEKVTNIDIENDQDIIITMENEGKLIHFGNDTNINDKFVKLAAVLEDTIRTKGRDIFKEYK